MFVFRCVSLVRFGYPNKKPKFLFYENVAQTKHVRKARMVASRSRIALVWLVIVYLQAIDCLHLRVPASGEKCLWQDVSESGQVVKIQYQVIEGGNLDLDFVVRSLFFWLYPRKRLSNSNFIYR